ncbi:MAG: acylneuraminate cytidylyltransferase family protein [Desulfobacula sp.]|nr:acylneuraminate cytidylyltransferase family protein [Desulfobacula sp.]
MKTVVALIPLRGGSKSIPQKNIKKIVGKPLCAWVLEAAVGCNAIDKVVVSTDCLEIKETVEGLELGVEVLRRPAELATDEATTESVMLHALQSLSFDTLITIQATSPLLESWHLDQAFQQFSLQQLDSLLSAARIKHFFWNDNCTPINYDPLRRPRRQDFAGTLMENGAFYITRRCTLKAHQCRLGGKIGIYEMSEETAIDIDEPKDWELVTRILEKREFKQGVNHAH